LSADFIFSARQNHLKRRLLLFTGDCLAKQAATVGASPANLSSWKIQKE
jgi:hypothetical protein